MTQITRLEVSNVKKLRAVSIEPDGSLVIIAGDNGAGKSSVLDSIMYILAGGRSIPEEPLRKGASRGYGKLELDNGLVVERTFTKKGSQLSVRQVVQLDPGDPPPTVDTQLLKSPQKVLDALYGQMSFDPLAFTRMKPPERLAMLQGMVQPDVRALLDSLESRERVAREGRTEVNREIKQLHALKLGDQAEDTGTIDTAEIAEKLQAIDEVVKASESERADAREWQQELNQIGHQVNVLMQERETMRIRIDAIEQLEKREAARTSELQNERRGAIERAEDLENRTPDKQPLLDQLARAGEQNAKAAAAADRNAQRKDLETFEKTQQRLNNVIEKANEDREAALREAALPIEGLTFDDSGVRVDGQPWDQASSAEQLRISAAMGIALNPDLKVLLIRDGSLLDETSLRMLSELAEGAGAQVWLEMVGDRADATVVLEDGHVRGKREMDWGSDGSEMREKVATSGHPQEQTDGGIIDAEGYDEVPYGEGTGEFERGRRVRGIDFGTDDRTAEIVVDTETGEVEETFDPEQRTAHVDEEGVDTPATEEAFGPQDGESESDRNRSRGPENDEWQTFGKRGRDDD